MRLSGTAGHFGSFKSAAGPLTHLFCFFLQFLSPVTAARSLTESVSSAPCLIASFASDEPAGADLKVNRTYREGSIDGTERAGEESRRFKPLGVIHATRLFPPDSNFVAVWIVKVRKLALVRIFFDLIGQESFTLQDR